MQQKLIESPNPWKSAMEEACIVNWCAFYENDPVATLRSIVNQDVMFALDPRISGDAQKLVEHGSALARYHVAKLLDPDTTTPEPVGPWMENTSQDETHQPCELLDEDTNRLVDYCGDNPESFNVAWEILNVLAKHGFVRATGKHSKPLADLIIDMLGETLSPSLQAWISENKNDPDLG
jgi:hypothetical protein